MWWLVAVFWLLRNCVYIGLGKSVRTYLLMCSVKPIRTKAKRNRHLYHHNHFHNPNTLIALFYFIYLYVLHLKIGLLISVICLLPQAFYFSNIARNLQQNEMSHEHKAMNEIRIKSIKNEHLSNKILRIFKIFRKF